ncbi:MAG: peroxidase family protein, partial [Saprospiraceae bacterium]
MYYRNIAHSSVGNNIIKAIEDYKKIADSTRTGSPLFDRLGERKEIGTPEDYRRIIPNIEEDSKYSTMFHNKKIDAGWTYFGQFITHDITIRREFGEIVPRLNLDCLYGLGQTSNGYLYDYQDNHSNHLPKGVCFALETYLKKDTNMLVYDVPRTGVEQSIPLMGDIRNDDNFLLSQLHCTFLRFHNQMVEFFYHREIVDPHELFKKTRQFVTWTYQWLIINEYLKLMTGKVSHDLISGQPSKILPVDSWNSLPVLLPEFIIAALRVGHSQVRQSYRLNAIDISDLSLFSLGNNEPDLSGFKRDDRRGFIDWSFFFHFDDQKKVQKSRPMDLFLADSMNHVPLLGGQSRNMGEVNIRRSIENKLVIMQDDMKVLRELGINSLGCFETELDALYNSAYDILPVPYDRRHPP